MPAGSRYKFSGPICVVYGLVFLDSVIICQLGTNPFRPSPDRPVTDSHSNIVHRVSSGSPLLGAPTRFGLNNAGT